MHKDMNYSASWQDTFHKVLTHLIKYAGVSGNSSRVYLYTCLGHPCIMAWHFVFVCWNVEDKIQTKQ
jgi:hypothetical protein